MHLTTKTLLLTTLLTPLNALYIPHLYQTCAGINCFRPQVKPIGDFNDFGNLPRPRIGVIVKSPTVSQRSHVPIVAQDKPVPTPPSQDNLPISKYEAAVKREAEPAPVPEPEAEALRYAWPRPEKDGDKPLFGGHIPENLGGGLNPTCQGSLDACTRRQRLQARKSVDIARQAEEKREALKIAERPACKGTFAACYPEVARLQNGIPKTPANTNPWSV